MTRLIISVLGAQPSAHTAAPGITLRLRIEEVEAGRVHAIALRCQTRIEPARRRYTSDEQARLYELFGDPPQWDRTLRAVTWAHSSLMVPSFERLIDVDLAIPCTYDLEVASAKYFHAIRDGDVPLLLLFSGTVFNANGNGLCVEPVPWDLEVSYRLPAAIWHAAMDRFFPGGGWLRLQRETIDRLQAFRGRYAVVTWDEAIDLLLDSAGSQDDSARETAEKDGSKRSKASHATAPEAAEKAASECSEASHANGASRRSGERESVWGSPRGEAPRMRDDVRAR